MYSKLFKKASAAVMAAAMALNGAVFTSANIFAADTKIEFEDGTATGTVEVASNANASGGKAMYMTEDGSITLDFDVPTAGLYTITIYAYGVGGSKQQTISFNGGAAENLAIPEGDGKSFYAIPLSVKLNEGKNSLTITKSWGWSQFDYITVAEAVLPEIKATQTELTDTSATAETRSLFAYLNSIYGEHILSGQQEIYQYGPHGLETEFEYLKDTTGHYPSIRGFDFGNRCCELFGANDDGSVSRIIDWVKVKGGIATASFHLNVPKDFASYTGGSMAFDQTTYSEKTDFSPEKAATPGTAENDYYTKALDILAADFNKLEAEGIPVLWRPLHEAEGGGGETGSWFWWGREGSEVYKKLYRYTYDYLTNEKNCHNLIWEWNSYDFATSADWYPGDDYVDIIGYDKYNCTQYLEENNWQPSLSHNDSSIASTFYSIMQRYNSAKMVTMAENDCFSTVENLTGDKAGWLYFLTWYDGGSDNINFLSNPVFNTKEDTIAMYQSEYCITLDELPEDLYTASTPTPTGTRTTTTTVSTTTTTTIADPTKEAAKIVYEKLDGSYKITLPRKSQEIYLQIEFPATVPMATGGLGTNVEVDGVTYWANVQWTANKSGDVLVDLDKNFLNCSIGADVVEDEAVIEAVKAELLNQTSFTGQIWWAGEDGDTSLVKINGAYLKAESTDTTTTTVSGTTPAATMLGDVDDSKSVTVSDIVIVLQYASNKDKYPLEGEKLANGDVNADGVVDAKDAFIIQQVDAGVIAQSALPVTE